MSDNRGDVRVVLVDDQQVVRETIQMTLVAAGFCCAVAGTVHELVQQLEAVRFDLAIIDHDMPGLDASDAVALVREHCPEATVVGHSGRSRRQEFLAMGANGFLQKPWILSELLPFLPSVGQ